MTMKTVQTSPQHNKQTFERSEKNKEYKSNCSNLNREMCVGMVCVDGEWRDDIDGG